MFMMTGVVEHTMGAWEELLDSVRLRILKLWSDRSGAEPVIDAELRPFAESAVGLYALHEG